MKLEFNNDVYNKNDTFFHNDMSQYIVTSEPKRKWYLLILQYLSLNYYKAPWVYNIKPINKYEE